jgi:para-nitrobenzyl esterase
MSVAHTSAVPVVETSLGWVSGFAENGVQTFLGIPYAAPPVGARRFRPPEPAQPWAGLRQATAYGASCPQLRGGQPGRPPPIWVDSPDVRLDEDCLFLNVWTGGAGRSRKRPVMIWVHTGGFGSGSGSAPLFEGANLVRRGDVVVVSLNHRLGVLGYLQLQHLDPAYDTSANVGMLDIVAALQWVRDNIEAFGGDPHRVILFGESGGGLKISTLMGMPAAQGLFHRAILQSGARPRHLDAERSRQATAAVMAQLGETSPARLQPVAVDALLAAGATANRSLKAEGPGLPHLFTPIVDGEAIPSHPFDPVASDVSADVDLLIGYNKTEASYFSKMGFGENDPNLSLEEAARRLTPVLGAHTGEVLAAFRAEFPQMTPYQLYIAAFTESPTGAFARLVARRKAAQGAAQVFMYRFDWDRAQWGSITGAPHMIELPFVFDNVDRAATMVGDAPETFALAAQVSAAWCAFAEVGDPSTPAMPNWPAYCAQTPLRMHIDLDSHVGPDLAEAPRRAVDAAFGL